MSFKSSQYNRTCLARWHDIPAGHTLDDAERGYVVEAICRWIAAQYVPTARRRDGIGAPPRLTGLDPVIRGATAV
ncbi:MAG TPA: DUF4186 family protein [Pseudonocardiaceae bacterium]|nr:DUF4186 family protein [Pseudonocardiaceae bacterium]